MVALVLALLPLMLIVILGSHGRLMGDDFCHLISGLEYGPWGNVLFWRQSLNGSFSFYFLHGLTGPLDTQAAGVIVFIIVVAWTFGLTWLILAGHRLLERERPPLIRTIMMAAALVWLSIHGLLSPLSIYFYSGATRYILPIAILVVALAACCECIPRVQSFRRLAVACVFFALVAFVNAGMSETFAIMQLVLLTTLLLAIYTMMPKASRRNSLALGMAGWAATVAALLVMATAPGVARRLGWFSEKTSLPLQSPADLLPKILEDIQDFLINAELSTAFIGMLAICLFLMLAVPRSAQTSPIGKPFQLAAPPLLLCLIAQLLLLPFVWTQQSDNPLLFGRFSPADDALVGIQILLLLSPAAMLLTRQRINAVFLNKPEYWAVIPVATLGIVFVLFSLTQIRGIGFHASRYVSCNIYLLLLFLLWQFHFHFQVTRKSRVFVAAFWAFTVIGMSALALVVIQQAIAGQLYLYSLPFISFAVAFLGFICGMSLAFAINKVNASTPAIRPTRVLVYGCGIVATAIWFGILLGNAKNISEFERFSRAWDERHQLILAKREGGERLAEAPRLAEDILKIPGGFWGFDYWHSSCASDEITLLIEARYRAQESIE